MVKKSIQQNNKNLISIKDNFNFGRISNFDKLINFENLTNLKEKTYLLSDICSDENIISLAKDAKRERDNELVLRVFKENGETFVQTGNFIGNFKIEEKKQISITSRFSDILLTRMLNVANNVFLQDVKFDAKVTNPSGNNNIVKYIIGYLFIQSLEKAYLLGIPKTYKTEKYHEPIIHGNIDFNQFIRKDIPFTGKISSITREQKYVTEIIDVLYTALKSVESIFSNDIMNRIKNVKNILKQNYSGKFTDSLVIDKAINHKTLLNSIYSEYNRVLNFAKILIEIKNIENKKQNNIESAGYLIDVSELWELYLTNSLRNHLDDWIVKPQYPIKVYYDNHNFFKREIRPDIVLFNNKTNKVAVFEAKYKKMNMVKGGGDGNYGDLDRSDFFQIHTYMSYFQGNNDFELVAGGLLYPFEKEINNDKCHSDNWLGGDGKFVVDGIDLSEFQNDNIDNLIKKENPLDKLIKEENDFIKRIKGIIRA